MISTPSATSCKAKREGSWRRETPDGVRNLLTSLIGKVWTKVEVEAQLQPLDNEGFKIWSAVTSPEARWDFKAGGFWSRGVTAFFYVRVTHVNPKCKQGNTTPTILEEEEEEKKRKYQQRVLDVEMGSFTPLVFETKNEEPYHITITWIGTLLSFEILMSAHTRVRGSRTPLNKIPQGDFIDDCRLNASQACVRWF